MSEARSEAKVQRILLLLIAVQAAILGIMFSRNPSRIGEYLGFAAGIQGTVLAWLRAVFITVAYVWSASALSDVKRYLFHPDRLKLIGVIAGTMAGIVEEVVFRKLVMDALQAQGFGTVVQVAASALAFGVVHLAWGIKNLAAGLNATLSTTVLGAALAIVYIVGDRSLAPCVAAHCIISSLIEPGLMLAAVSGRMGLWRERRSA